MKKNVLKFILGLKIRRLRSKRGYSLKDLSLRSGLSHSYLNEIEKGKKYPKVEKIISLASALGVDKEELLNVKMGKQFHPLMEFLESNLANNLPLSAFGIGEQDIYDIMSHGPEKFASFIMTVAELAKSYDISVDDLNKSALRTYIEINSNYFPFLEELGSSYSRQIKEIISGDCYEKMTERLMLKLKKEFGVAVDLRTLGSGARPLGLKSIYREKKKNKVLFVNCNLDYKQKIFALIKELGAQQLVSDDSNKRRDPLKKQFGDLLLDFQTHYFACAVLLPEEDFVKEIQTVFQLPHFDEKLFNKILARSAAPEEILMGRLAQILPRHFKLNQLFYLRCNEDYAKAPGSYFISQELHLGQLHHPHGVSLRERYCRRWITTSVLGLLSDQIAENSNGINEEKSEGVILGTQISQMGESGASYFCLSLARKRTTVEGVISSLTLGIPIDESFKARIQFSEDPRIEKKVVGRTCERCSLSDCEERVAPPSILLRERLEEEKRNSIKEILEFDTRVKR